MDLGPPSDLTGRFAPERTALLGTLGGLDTGSWAATTACPGWTVHDVALHLLGGDLGRLARTRDGWEPLGPGPGEAFEPFLHRVNDEWVLAGRRLSPALLVGLLAWTGEQIEQLWAAAELGALGEPVSWARPGAPAPVWLDAARDWSECWVHHEQLRSALDLPPRADADVLDTYLRALPWTLRDVVRPAGTTLDVAVPDLAAAWHVVAADEGWAFRRGRSSTPSATVTATSRTLWRLGSRGIEPEEADAAVDGDIELASAALRFVSVIR